MKKTLLLLSLTFTTFVFSQTPDNTLPPSGYVGVGTLSPTERLTVNGNMKIDSSLVVKDSVRIQKRLTVEQDLKVQGDIYLTNPDQDTNSNNYILTIDANGKVVRGVKSGELEGINELMPDCPLIPGAVISNPKWFNLPNTIYTYCPQINVGVGTNSPVSKLQVLGTTTTSAINIGSGSFSNGTLVIHTPQSLGSNVHPLIIENNQRKLLQLDNSGLLKVREILIDAQTWADFVFEPDYQLMPLSEVESYIQANGHLPNVPSEKDVIEEGINLAEMNAVLLQKIEELTLHLIEQDKRINELEKALQK